jgi:hypothetical protein
VKRVADLGEPDRIRTMTQQEMDRRNRPDDVQNRSRNSRRIAFAPPPDTRGRCFDVDDRRAVGDFIRRSGRCNRNLVPHQAPNPVSNVRSPRRVDQPSARKDSGSARRSETPTRARKVRSARRLVQPLSVESDRSQLLYGDLLAFSLCVRLGELIRVGVPPHAVSEIP